jgi:hypothetical protein
MGWLFGRHFHELYDFVVGPLAVLLGASYQRAMHRDVARGMDPFALGGASIASVAVGAFVGSVIEPYLVPSPEPPTAKPIAAAAPSTRGAPSAVVLPPAPPVEVASSRAPATGVVSSRPTASSKKRPDPTHRDPEINEGSERQRANKPAPEKLLVDEMDRCITSRTLDDVNVAELHCQACASVQSGRLRVLSVQCGGGKAQSCIRDLAFNVESKDMPEFCRTLPRYRSMKAAAVSPTPPTVADPPAAPPPPDPNTSPYD